MNTNRFLYQLIRFIPDLHRMEPRNIGVVVQGGGIIDYKINAHSVTWKEAKPYSNTLKKWFKFFEDEIKAPLPLEDDLLVPISTLMPPRESEKFLDHLAKQSRGQIKVTRAFTMEYRQAIDIKEVLSTLYNDLVATPKEEKESDSDTDFTPTRKFNAIAKSNNFFNRGLNKFHHVHLPNGDSRAVYASIINGAATLIENVTNPKHFDDFRSHMDSAKLLLNGFPSREKAKGYKVNILMDELICPSYLASAEERAYKKGYEDIGSRADDLGFKVLISEADATRLGDEIEEIIKSKAIHH